MAVAAVGALTTPAAPRIDISRASSSSHHDSRDSSPELALFAGTGSEDARGRLELGFREDGALELRSSTEELAFLEGAPGEPRPAAPPPPTISRRHSRKDSQGSEAALLAVSGRTSRLSSVGSQCSAHSALSAFSHASRVSRLSVVSGVSRSPSPHRMLLETSFCGPKPIETDPEICAAAVEERLLEIAKMTASSPPGAPPAPVDARDRREVRTEATVERASRPPPPSPQPAPAPPLPPVTPAAPAPSPAPTSAPIVITPVAPDDEKLQKETQNRARVQERRARPRVRREPSEPEVYKSGNRTKDIIRIKLKPDDEYEETEEETPSTSQQPVAVRDVNEEAARKPVSLELTSRNERAVRPTELVGRSEPAPVSPAARNRAPRDSRTPSPANVPVSRKSSFCSLFKSRETIASPDSPSEALRRKRSLTEGRSRSKSRDRSATPSSAGKIRGSVLSLFRTPRKSGASPSPGSREGSPVVQQQRTIAAIPQPTVGPKRGEKLKYYEDTRDGIIHIPLRTPPDEQPGSSSARRDPEPEKAVTEVTNVTTHREPQRPASAPHTRAPPEREFVPTSTQKPVHRTVLPDGSIIIPLRSPTEHTSNDRQPSPPANVVSPPALSKQTEPEPPHRSPSASSTGATSLGSTRPVECTPEAAPNVDHVEPAPGIDETRRRRKERIIFTTHVGSREQVFSTQFSITKTPSVTSEISGSFPSFVDPDETRSQPSQPPREASITEGSPPGIERDIGAVASVDASSAATPSSPQEVVRDSSESEPSSESAPPRGGNDVERRGLVVQESFEEELPYVPTTLPQERSVALPMVPVRERGGVHVASVERPRAAMPAPPPPVPAALTPRVSRPMPAPVPIPAPTPPDRLRIRLPRRPRTASVATISAPRTERLRTRSGSDGNISIYLLTLIVNNPNTGINSKKSKYGINSK